MVACWRTEAGGYEVQPWFFCPEEALRVKGERHGVDYVSWAEDGHVIPAPGNTVDMRAIEAHIRELRQVSCAGNSLRSRLGRVMLADLAEDGLPAVEMRPGWVTMGPAVKNWNG